MQKQTPPFVTRDRGAIMGWLTVCCLLVALMVAVGGYTRLSGSGLSIVQWKPVHGTLPPMSDAQWQEEFAAYKTSPQYQKVNNGMSLDEFKTIFWPEFIHRLLGRLVGVVFFVPLIVFAARRSLPVKLGWRLLGIFALGGVQGLIGWVMVASGLVDDPNVSAIKLALHLSTALAIFALILWTLLDVSAPLYRPLSLIKSSAPKWYKVWFTALVLQVVLGAFMAGLHAGLLYDSWPSMNGQYLPDGLTDGPLHENRTLIQFLHRNLAIIVVLGFLFWWRSFREYVKNGHLGKVCAGVAAILALQFFLGVLTLIHHVPLALALAHQLTALLLFATATGLMHKMIRQ